VNTEELLERLDDDREFLAELTVIFRADYPPRLHAIGESIANNDAAGVRNASHALRGTLANLAASKAEEMAADLERSAALGEMKGAKDALQDLKHELVNTVNALESLCGERAS
jgi:HPt (histidine-containing phosphotransfer) domain-containing protein